MILKLLLRVDECHVALIAHLTNLLFVVIIYKNWENIVICEFWEESLLHDPMHDCNVQHLVAFEVIQCLPLEICLDVVILILQVSKNENICLCDGILIKVQSQIAI